ncbi:MAG: hypothetical protein QM536_09580 [Chitinophagaceae bacterium]|nr:hypothetical protein [Chitinophagaceae bacterium]
MNTLKEKGVKFGTKKYVLNEENSEEVILQLSNIVDENTKNKVIDHFKNLENNNFENIENILQKAKLEKIIETFEKNIKNCDESFWQNFFEENT